jgi:catechol 2,3-dioxygenase-like lactoylglutathione lyase family enzyme
VDEAFHGTLHHVELWVPNLDRAAASWGWLLKELGYELFQDWPGGQSWRCGPTYIVLEQSPARTATRHDRCRPGLNHLAFHVESQARTDELSVDAGQNGWRMMFADQYPYAGGTGHYAAYLENIDGFEVELVAPAEAAESPAADSPVPAEADPAQPAVPAQAEPAEAVDPASLVGAASPILAGPAAASSAWLAEPVTPADPGPPPAPPVASASASEDSLPLRVSSPMNVFEPIRREPEPGPGA